MSFQRQCIYLLAVILLCGCGSAAGPGGSDPGAGVSDASKGDVVSGGGADADAGSVAETVAETVADAVAVAETVADVVADVVADTDTETDAAVDTADAAADGGADPCAEGVPTPCTTLCGSTGSRSCLGGKLGPCVPPEESCATCADDDCDGKTNEGCPPDPDCDTEPELCDCRDNDGDGTTDENCDPLPDCIDGACNCEDDDGDGLTDEGCWPKPDCYDGGDCDCVDNDGDGQTDEGCVPKPVCDGDCDCIDSDGDGQTDEDCPYTPDCSEAKTCDCLDNDGDGLTDEGCVPLSDCEGECDWKDNDGDGKVDEGCPNAPPCGQERYCDCKDNDGDGLTDEGCELANVDCPTAFPTEAKLEVHPGRVNLGVTTVGCASAPAVASFYNGGNALMELSDVHLDPDCSSEFEIVQMGALPKLLTHCTPFKVSIRFVPQDAGSESCDLVGHAGGPDGSEVRVEILAAGTFEGVQTDVFEQSSGEVDVIFVVDNSGSMWKEIKNLGTNIDAFVTKADLWEADYRLALVSTDIPKDGGRFRTEPRWIQSDTPDGLTLFSDAVKALGSSGSAMEQGLEAAYRAVTPPNSSVRVTTEGAPVPCSTAADCPPSSLCLPDPKAPAGSPPASFCAGRNWGFLRPLASLEVVVISDEDDSSVQGLPFYLDFFSGLVSQGLTAAVHVHAIVGEIPYGCSNIFGNADPGHAYILAAEATGGMVATICQKDYGASLGELGQVAFSPKTRFYLSRPAVPESVAVAVAGSLCAEGWTYEAVTGSVVFDPAGPCMPGVSELIEIQYEAICLEP